MNYFTSRIGIICGQFTENMAGNTFGQLFRITTFGESHGAAIGGVVDGCPAGIEFDEVLLIREMQRRRPGQSQIVSPRNEDDIVQILSGIFEGKTTGTPIGFTIQNKDQKSVDYEKYKDVFRPGHADHTWNEKFGTRDHRGGGRASARETSARVAAGAIAKMFLNKTSQIKIHAFVSDIHDIHLDRNYNLYDLSLSETNVVRCPDPTLAQKMIGLIEETRAQKNSLGGIITCIASGLSVGLGEPVFDKLPAVLAHAMMSINAVKGFEMGEGFASAAMKGTEMNDQWSDDGKLTSNHAGGVSGGISNGQDLVFRIAFKPTSSISSLQSALTASGEVTQIGIEGRHDPCVVPRAVPIVEAMCAIVLADFLLLTKTNQA
ncbi:MAG: chorismate synthase [Flavobacteriales bacterium]|nr:chorismate synthase [Flavobacteriales bacterium]